MGIDWNQYLSEVQEPEEEVVQEQPQFELPQDTAPVQWEKYRDPEDRGYLEEAERHVSRLGSRIGESIVGLPGNVVQMVNWIDSKVPKPPSFLQREPNFVQKTGKEMIERLPTSPELKEKMSELTDGFTDPQGAVEEFGDSIIELASALLIGKDPTKIRSVLGAIGKATAAKGLKKGAEKLGAGEKGQFAVEMGTLFTMDFMNSSMANKFVSDKYQKAREMIPQGAMISTGGLTSELESLEAELSKGLSTATKDEVKSAVSELKAKTSGGAYPAEELVDAFHDINENMSSKKLFNELSSTQQKKLKFRYDQFKDKVTSEIEKYGKSNPEFIAEWSEANEAYSTIAESRKVSNFIEKKMGKLPPHIATGVAIELFHGGPAAGAAAIGGAAATFGGLKTGEMLYRIGKSPSLRKHYLDVIKFAADENLPAMINSMSRLEDGIKESFVSGED